MRIDRVGLHLRRGYRSYSVRMCQLNRADVIDRVQPVVHHAPVPARFDYCPAWFSQRREKPLQRPKVVRQSRGGPGSPALVNYMHLRVTFVVIYSRVQHWGRSSCSQLVIFDTHHYTTELDPFFMLPARPLYLACSFSSR